MLEYSKLFVDLMKALAWPGLLGFIVWWFSPDLRRLLPRVRKAGPTGVEFDLIEQAAIAQTREITELPGINRTPAMERVETNLLKMLESYVPDKRIPMLAQALAQTRLEAHFERVHRVIFGTQVEGLKLLAQEPNGRVTREQAETWFAAQVRTKHPEFYAQAKFANWLQYLISALLVDADANKVAITDIGRDFLIYMQAVGLPDDRPN